MSKPTQQPAVTPRKQYSYEEVKGCDRDTVAHMVTIGTIARETWYAYNRMLLARTRTPCPCGCGSVVHS